MASCKVCVPLGQICNLLILFFFHFVSVCRICFIIIINEFHRDASLTKTLGPLCVTCFTSVSGTVAGGVRCRMIYGTVPSYIQVLHSYK